MKHLKVSKIILQAVLLLIVFSTNIWFRRVMTENLLIFIAYICTSVLLTFYFLYGSKLLEIPAVIFFIILLLFQVSTTNVKNAYSYTPSQIDEQIQRMNYYPPKLARLGYIMENKVEVKKAETFISNSITVLDFNTYFPDYFSIILFPVFFYGLFLFVGKNIGNDRLNKSKIFINLLISSLFILSFLGVNGKYGPFLFFPFIVALTVYALMRILYKLNIYEKREN